MRARFGGVWVLDGGWEVGRGYKRVGMDGMG